ncbi:MAG: hypothetical protein ACREO8_02210, partial [Luteimonas sp.]
ADNGVSRHHALINLVGNSASLRALDAPLRLDGAPLQPGDPVRLRALQCIQLGDASIAFGGEHDPAWATLLAMAADAPGTGAPSLRARRLPAIAALAVLSLASVAIFAAVMPASDQPIDAKAALLGLIDEFQIREGRTSQDVNGDPVLSGTVDRGSTRDRIQERIEADGIAATLDLRTGEKIAEDVREVLRSQGINASTRYLGNGEVEASGRFEDMAAMRAAAQSRSMHEVTGVTRVMVRNYAESEASNTPTTATAAAASAVDVPVRIVSIVRGDDPHLVGVDGALYAVGAELPGRGSLVSIGASVHVLGKDGQLQKVKAEPVTPAELAAAAEKKLADDTAADTAARHAADAVASADPRQDIGIARASKKL